MADAPMSTPEIPPDPTTSAWQPAAPVAAPGIPGFVYADVPNRFIALVLDALVMGLILLAVGAALAGVGLRAGIMRSDVDLVGSLVYAVINLAIGGGYFIYTWTTMRASIGMRALGMQVGNAFDGRTLTMEQAIRRWLALWGPSIVSGAFASLPVVGNLISLAVFVYLCYLLFSTAKSPTKQGFHDIFANTVVVKAARTV